MQKPFEAIQNSLQLKLVCNADKTELMLIYKSGKQKQKTISVTTLARNEIDVVQEYKYFGVVIDDFPTFTPI